MDHNPAAGNAARGAILTVAFSEMFVHAGRPMNIPNLPASKSDLSVMSRYQETANRIIGSAMADKEAWERLTALSSSELAPRICGSEQLQRALNWARDLMTKDGLDNAVLQAVKVPHWVRGEEYVELLGPERKRLDMLGLGGSIGTPPDGITAPVVVVRNFDELEKLGREKVEGRIVLYAVEWDGYSTTSPYRGKGASCAARLGAVASLVRSVTSSEDSPPHTGAMSYAKDAPKIPAAALTVPDTMRLRDLAASGEEISLRLYMEAKTLPDIDSANVLAEITGSEKPEEIVVMGGHIDSWDVGQGAHDDGAGCIAAWGALRTIQKLGLKPRRTLRVAFWVDEEQGCSGGRGYRAALGDDVSNHVAAIEMDGGCEKPIGFGFGLQNMSTDGASPVYEAAYQTVCDILALTESIGTNEAIRGGGGVDIQPLKKAGVPVFGLKTVGEHYFDWHHAATDTIDQIDPDNFRHATASLAILGYVLADMPGRL